MPVLNQSDCRNRLLRQMSVGDFGRLAPDLQPVELPKGLHLVAPARNGYIYFPESGVISIMTTSPLGRKVETGLFGRDGFGPVCILLGSDPAPGELVTQLAGQSYRLPRAALIKATDDSASLRNLLLHYVQLLWAQAARTALSSAVHNVEERLARWILMVHDRVETDEIAITHDAIALALSVRRPSVTTALHVLEGCHLIRSERGLITIRNRTALEHLAQDSYVALEAANARPIGPIVTVSAEARSGPAHQITPDTPDGPLSDRERQAAHHERRLTQKGLRLASAEDALAAGREDERWKLKADVNKLRSAVLRLEATIYQG